MAYTLMATQDLAGAGVWNAAIADCDAMWVHVTNFGDAREMDPHSPPRLFNIGWLAIGDADPETPGVMSWFPPMWIEYEHSVFNISAMTDMSPVPLGVDAIRYELHNGAEVTVNLARFT